MGDRPPTAPEPGSAPALGRVRPGGPATGGERVILHVDMDAFFASVEVLDDPSLAGLPVIVGGSGRRGVVAACTYEARRFGVHSAMPSSVARRLCPTAVFVDGRFHRYVEESVKLHAILQSVTPLVEGISLDEAFLDVTGSVQLLGDGPTIAHAVRRRVADELHLACSVGVGRSKLMAKLASKAAKPSASRTGIVTGPGVVVVPPERELAFLHPLPVRALWGVGPVTGRKLESLGILTVGDLASLPAGSLQRYLGTALGDAPGRAGPRPRSTAGRPRAGGEVDRARGDLPLRPLGPRRAPRPPPPDGGRVGHRPPRFGADRPDRHRQDPVLGLLHDHPEPLPALADRRLAGHRLGGRRAPGLGRAGPGGSTARGQPVRIRRSAERAPAEPGSRSAAGRLGGIRAGGRWRCRPEEVAPADRLARAQDEAERIQASWATVTAAVDAIRARYGGGSVGPASLVGADGLRVRRRGEAQWGPTAQSGPPN